MRRAVDAVLGGDREAFRYLVDRESATVVRACHRVLGDLDEAEDAAQESFVIAYRSLAGWRGDGSFGAWLGRIAVRTALRRAKARRPVARIDPTDPDRLVRAAPDGSGAADDRASLAAIALGLSAVTDPAAISLRAERAETIRRAVTELDDPYRETVMLRFYAELSLAEIAAETGRPIGTVKTHLFRGLARLRDALDSDEANR
ncbi:MAG TPA: sigma-70 family RNA polymerase sigma factor [Patescibacteria group bacterium]|nr:sigma-70 family RNA polymerase sigma factor [Patescibacteria group bacterium]